MSSLGNKVAFYAKLSVGTPYDSGDLPGCALWTRHILRQAGLENLADRVTRDPADGVLPTGYGFANGLAGNDIGTKVMDMNALLPGDLVFFHNTYGDYAPGTITHVGIYVGNGIWCSNPSPGQAIRCERMNAFWKGLFQEARRVC